MPPPAAVADPYVQEKLLTAIAEIFTTDEALAAEADRNLRATNCPFPRVVGGGGSSD